MKMLPTSVADRDDRADRGAGRAVVARCVATAAKPAPAISPDAISALQKMGDFLRNQQTFAVQARMTTDDQLAVGSEGAVRRDGRPEDPPARTGCAWTSQAIAATNACTTTARHSPCSAERRLLRDVRRAGTLTELKDVLEKQYAIDLPLADLFYWGTEHDGTAAIQAATRVGAANVDGFVTDHYAFRQKDVDWELWIEQGGRPVPRKLVITTTAEQNQAAARMVLNWDLAPKFEDQLFTFVPPANVHQIEFETTAAHERQRPREEERNDHEREGTSRCRDRRHAGLVRRAARWRPPPRRRSSSGPRSNYRPVPPGGARGRRRRRPWSEPRRWSAAWSTRCRPRARRWSSATSPTSIAATPGISRATRVPGHLRRRQSAAAVSTVERPRQRGRAYSQARSARATRRPSTVGWWSAASTQVVFRESSRRRRRASSPAPRASRAYPRAGRTRWRRGSALFGQARRAGQRLRPLVTVQPVPSLLQVRVNVMAPPDESAPTQVLTITSCPGGMSPPVAARRRARRRP